MHVDRDPTYIMKGQLKYVYFFKMLQSYVVLQYSLCEALQAFFLVYLSFKVIVLNNTVHSRKVNLITYKNVLMLLKDEKQECVVSFTVCKDRAVDTFGQ